MATTSPFDPDKVDPEFYSKDPEQHGDSDYGRVSEGIGTNEITTSGMDMDAGQQEDITATRESHIGEGNPEEPRGEKYGTTQAWDVNADSIDDQDIPKGKMMSDEANAKLEQIADNPSDDALFHRADATYLEQGDNPNEGYDPHHKGYSDKEGEE